MQRQSNCCGCIAVWKWIRVKGERLPWNIFPEKKWPLHSSATACSLLSLEAFKLTGLIMCELPIFPFGFHGLSVSTLPAHLAAASPMYPLADNHYLFTGFYPENELGRGKEIVCLCLCVREGGVCGCRQWQALWKGPSFLLTIWQGSSCKQTATTSVILPIALYCKWEGDSHLTCIHTYKHTVHTSTCRCIHM